ncbi:MAG: hypothetical protein FJX37_09615 [Alphaproteobacteria bacterium]|nr:hypothetical protein [Alphaproteobacteria bacterium]MBM3952207.1 hypothetical protein [Rhodospirillales bacterium]
MAQQFLDPKDTKVNGEWRPSRALEAAVRDKFGRYPNINEWRPGDLLLFNIPENTPLGSKLIIKAQHANYVIEHARWHHAAVYVGDGFLCEADIGGVRHVEIDKYLGRHLIRVRRDMTLSIDDQYKIALRAMTRLREDYGFRQILALAFHGIRGSWYPSQLALGSRGVICSHLYNYAYMGVTKRLLFSTGDRPIIPAELSLTDVLSDVPVYWHRISRS